MSSLPDLDLLAQGLRAGERRALSRAITLVESGRADHRAAAEALLERLKGAPQALRIGLSGTPGVGKSTFIESFGLSLVDAGLRVAVLAVDPSSARSGGSILGDKTRMEQLSRAPNAFIRPSPSQAQLGGVARRTREAVTLCEAAGFDVVLIETVGVGQSETMVAQISDLFVLLLAPAGGDELQGVKRGIMETADLILVNKADGDLRAQALRTCADYAGALRLMRKRPQDPDGYPKAMTLSAVTGDGIDTAWDAMQTLANWRRENGHWQVNRAEQARHWFREELRAATLARAASDTRALEQAVAEGRMAVGAAVQAALGGVVEILTYHLRADLAEAFAQIMQTQSLPLHQQAGLTVLRAAPSDCDPQHYVLIRRFASSQAMETQLAAFYASAAWRDGPRAQIIAAIEQTHQVVLGVDSLAGIG